MAMDSARFRLGMRKLCAGVTIVTTLEDDKRFGMTATAVCSLSAEPPRLLACLNRSGVTYAAIAASRRFGINLLAGDQQALAGRFAGFQDLGEADRFEAGAWTALETGTPLLKGALAAFDCRVANIMDTGSHAIIIGDVVAAMVNDGDQPLLYMDGGFMTCTALDLPETETKRRRA